MAAIKAVEEPVQDPKTGRDRPQSSTEFPYRDLADAVEVAKTIYDKMGGACDRAQLAAVLGHKSVNSGSFLSRVSAAKMFGVIEQTPDWTIQLTPRGKAIVKPILPHLADQAKLEAFFSVELFKKVYEQYEGMELPAEVGLANLFEQTYGIVASRVQPTVRIMLDSAEYAGLFRATGTRARMVKPLSGNGGAEPLPQPVNSPPEVNTRPGGGGGGGGGGGNGNGGGQDTSGIDPAILGLLKRLPPGGTPLTKARRDALIAAFTATVAFIYPDAREDEAA